MQRDSAVALGVSVADIWAELSQANRLYRLQGCGDAGSDALAQLLRVEGWIQREAISQLFELRIVCLSLDAGLELKTMVGAPLTLLTVSADGQLIERSGLIRAAESLGADGGLARYRLTLVPWLWLATQQGRSQVFQNRRVAEIIELVLAPYAQDGPWAFSPEVPLFLADAPVRTYCTQYRESDFDFLARLLAEEGLAWRVEQDEAAPMGHKIVIFADSAQQPQDKSSPLRFHRRGAQEQSDAVQALVRRTRQAAAQVHLSCWHVDAKRQISGCAPARFAVGGERAAQIEYDDVLGLSDQARGWNDSRTVERYAGLLMEAAECRADMLLGHASARSLRAGTRVHIDDAPALGLKAAPQLVLDTIEHVGLNNLPGASTSAIAARLGEAQAHLAFDAPCAPADAEPNVAALVGLRQPEAITLHPDAQTLAAALASGYANRFAAMHQARPWRPAIVAANGSRLHAKPTACGVHGAIVVGPEGQREPQGADEIYCNARGDVRVRFHWQEDDDGEGNAGRPDNRSTRWIRVAQRQAGPGMGWQWLPRIGQEVMVRFVDGDVDQPIVVGALYNGRGEGGQPPTPGGRTRGEPDSEVFALASDATPSAQANLAGGHAPPWHGASASPEGHRNAAALTGFKTKEFGGAGFSQLVFDDSDEQLRIQLHASSAHSQLNLGHLIHQQGNYRGSFRGQGLELRTDAYAALRGGQGVLLTTYHGPGGQRLEPTGDLAAGIALAQQATTLGGALSGAAKTHQTVKLAGHEGALKADASMLDEDKAPLAALQRAMSGMVDGLELDEARADAAEKCTATGNAKVPHTAGAVVALAARGGLALVAGQHAQIVAGETVNLTSGGEVNLALAQTLRVHSGQAIGWLAGAKEADDAGQGLRVIAGEGDLDFQAQHDELKIQAKGQLKLASTTKTLEMAAAKRIRIATAGGASITLEGGNITFECPGKITYRATFRKLAGPTRGSYKLPVFPDSTTHPSKRHMMFSLGALPGLMQNYAGEPYTLYADGAVLQTGTADEVGSLMWDHKEGTQQYKVELVTGQIFEIEVLDTFSERGQRLANEGYRGYTSEAAQRANFGADGDAYRERVATGKSKD